MPSHKVLRCPTKHRMQRLLWTPEYESYMNLGSDDEPIVLVESPFVVERKDDGVDKMVYVCLTTESLLIGEEKTRAKQEVGTESLENADNLDNCTTACRYVEEGGDGETREEGDWDLQDFRLRYLFPLQHVRLSIRQYREKDGEHVLRLRVGEGADHPKTWYLELAGRHREVVWTWWRNWIEELEERRKEERHRLKVYKKKIKSAAIDTVEFGELNLDWRRDDHGLVVSPKPRLIKPSEPGWDRERTDLEKLRLLKVRREELRTWHIKEHKKRIAEKHPEVATVGQCESALGFLFKEPTEADIISQCILHGVPVPTDFPPPDAFYAKIGLPVPRSLDVLQEEGVVTSHNAPAVHATVSIEINSCSSLDDIMSVGSLVDSDVDWHHAVSDEVNDRLVLCVGDLFEKSNVEIHEHGHAGRVRPMASDTALAHLLEFEETNLAIDDKHHTFVGIDKEELHHTFSVPDILEGEAAFLEDDYEASQVTHRNSFVALDVANENTHLQAHIINGHVLLVTKKELRLEKELIKFREEPHDLDFTTCKHKGKTLQMKDGKGKKKKRVAGTVQKYKDAKKAQKELNAKHGIGDKFKKKLHIGAASRMHMDGTKGALRFMKHNVLLMDELPPWAVGLPEYFTTTTGEIPPEALARELTLIDKELFLMIHESELVDCMWMKHDKHSKAPNVLKSIEFFERVVRTVAADIVKRNYDWARAKTMAYFTQVAQKCFELQNYHSLKAILCGLQIPSIYRLKHTWTDFEELHPEEYRVFLELAHLMRDDGCSEEYLSRLQEAEKSPPYLPFLGAFLKSLIGLFTIKDEGGMRSNLHRRHDKELAAEPVDPCGCSTAAKHGVCYHSESDHGEDDDDAEEGNEDDVEDDEDDFAKFFRKIDATGTNNTKSNWVAEPTHNVVMEKSSAYLMNETLFHYQIAAIQYKWIDLPQVREFWLRIRLADEVELWNTSCKKEDMNRDREDKEIRLARKARVEEEYRKRQERMAMREKLAKEAVKSQGVKSKASLFFGKTKSKLVGPKKSIFRRN